MNEIKSLIDDDIKENIDHSIICVKFAMMSKQLEEKDKEIERLNNIINELEKLNDANYQSFIETNKILLELEKWIKEILKSKAYSIGYKEAYKDIYLKLQELKDSDKNVS